MRWEGSGGAIRVTPQLIRASDDSQLWSERYDAKLANVFEVQATIAEQVARALDLAITGPERKALAARPTENLEAYAYYLRGNDYLSGSWGEDRRLSIAMEMYAKAVQLDPALRPGARPALDGALELLRLHHRRPARGPRHGQDRGGDRAPAAAQSAGGARRAGVLSLPRAQGVRRGAARALDRRQPAAQQRRGGRGDRPGGAAAGEAARGRRPTQARGGARPSLGRHRLRHRANRLADARLPRGRAVPGSGHRARPGLGGATRAEGVALRLLAGRRGGGETGHGRARSPSSDWGTWSAI